MGLFPFVGGWWLLLIFDYTANQIVFRCQIVILQLANLEGRKARVLSRTQQYFVVTLFGYSVGGWKQVGGVKQKSEVAARF